MKLLVFYNLASGISDGSIYDFIRSFAQAGDEIVIRYAAPGINFESLLKDANQFDTVIACGGDGTVATVLYTLRNTSMPVLPFPAGTANLLAQNLYSPVDSPALANLVRSGRRLDCDLCELKAKNFKTGFTIMAGCGYDAKIMQDAASIKHILGPLAYFQSAFANPLPQVSKFSLDIDGKHIECSGICVLVMNYSKINMEISLKQDSSPCDGMLDILVIKSETALELLPAFLGASLNPTAGLSDEKLVYYRGRNVHVDADPPMTIQYDGEPLDITTPFDARVIPSSARIIMSDQAYDEFTKKSRRK